MTTLTWPVLLYLKDKSILEMARVSKCAFSIEGKFRHLKGTSYPKVIRGTSGNFDVNVCKVKCVDLL
jgi:hypothetical protein